MNGATGLPPVPILVDCWHLPSPARFLICSPLLMTCAAQDKALKAAVEEQADIMARHGDSLDMEVLGDMEVRKVIRHSVHLK